MSTQKERLLELLREGPVNSYHATYKMRIKQAPTRIKELKEQGYTIISITNKDRSVNWILDGEPAKPKESRWEIGEDDIARKVYLE